jgi:hypothetical protein
MALISTYFKYSDELKEKYGEKTIVMMQVGAFYEMYGLLNSETNEITGSNSAAVCALCELSLVKKKCLCW